MNKKDNLNMNKEKSSLENFANENGHCEVGEDATKYGEFVSSYFAWIPLPKQKERAEELDKMTKKDGEGKSK